MRKREIPTAGRLHIMTAVPLDERKEWYRSLRTEYEVAMKFAIHCTELNWQVGSILVGGSLAAVALTLTTKAKIPTALVTSGAVIAITAWFLFLRRNRDFAAIATDRMILIEQELGLTNGNRSWGLQTRLRNTVPVPATNQQIARPSGYHTAAFLATGLILVLSALVVYVLLFG
jgi:hypothetical protein